MSTDKHTPLLPCPFCGSHPVVRRVVEEYLAEADSPAGEYDARFTIECDECGISVGEEYRSDAVVAWNKRTGNALLVKAAEFSKAALTALEGYEADYGEPLPDDHEIGRIDDSRHSASFRIRVGHIRRLAAALASAGQPS